MPRLKELQELMIAVVAGCLAAWGALPLQEESAGPRVVVPIAVLDVKDGDTILADLLLPWDVTLRGQSIRENSYDAWESSKRRQSEAAGPITDEEVAKGKIATDALKALLAEGEVFLEPQRKEGSYGERDVFGRVLGKLWVHRDEKWIDVGKEMIRAGHDRRRGVP